MIGIVRFEFSDLVGIRFEFCNNTTKVFSCPKYLFGRMSMQWYVWASFCLCAWGMNDDYERGWGGWVKIITGGKAGNTYTCLYWCTYFSHGHFVRNTLDPLRWFAVTVNHMHHNTRPPNHWNGVFHSDSGPIVSVNTYVCKNKNMHGPEIPWSPRLTHHDTAQSVLLKPWPTMILQYRVFEASSYA